MTSKRRFNVDCLECGRRNIKCPNCNNNLKSDTKFSRWLRGLPYPNSGNQTSAQNLDYIWFKFRDGWFITIEEKTNGKEYNPTNKSDLSQIQSHGLIRQMLDASSNKEYDISFGNWKRNEKIEYRGHYLIVFEKTNPDDSTWIKINGHLCNKKNLLWLLQYGILFDLNNERKS